METMNKEQSDKLHNEFKQKILPGFVEAICIQGLIAITRKYNMKEEEQKILNMINKKQ